MAMMTRVDDLKEMSEIDSAKCENWLDDEYIRMDIFVYVRRWSAIVSSSQ